MNCPMCAVSETAVFARWPNYSVLECQGCGFRFVDSMAPNYPTDAQYVYDDEEIGTIRPNAPHIQRRVRDILLHKRPPARALDIGCGKGEVALALGQAGFDAMGIDMKPRLIEHLRARFTSVEWSTRTERDLATLPGRFDILTMYHVLEHVQDPREVMMAVRALANPGALIVVEVPNVEGWEARLKGREWHYYKIDHLNYFRPSDLRALARHAGLTVLETRGYQHFSYPQNVTWKDLIKGMLGRLGFNDVTSIFMRA